MINSIHKAYAEQYDLINGDNPFPDSNQTTAEVSVNNSLEYTSNSCKELVNGHVSEQHSIMLATNPVLTIMEEDQQIQSFHNNTDDDSEENESESESRTSNTEYFLPLLSDLICNTPSQISPVIEFFLNYLWDVRQMTIPNKRESVLKDVSFPGKLLYVNPKLNDIHTEGLANYSFINRFLLFDYLKELILQIYDGENAEQTKVGKLILNAPITSSQYRLWQGSTRPNTLKQLTKVVLPQLQRDLGLRLYDTPYRPHTRQLPRLTRWTLGRKASLDQLLEAEMRADESNWLSYAEEEELVKREMAKEIFAELLNDVVNDCLASQNRFPRSRNPSSVF